MIFALCPCGTCREPGPLPPCVSRMLVWNRKENRHGNQMLPCLTEKLSHCEHSLHGEARNPASICNENTAQPLDIARAPEGADNSFHDRIGVTK